MIIHPFIPRPPDYDSDASSTEDNASVLDDVTPINHFGVPGVELFIGNNSFATLTTPLCNYDNKGWVEDSENLFLPHRFLHLPGLTYSAHFSQCSYDPHLYDHIHHTKHTPPALVSTPRIMLNFVRLQHDHSDPRLLLNTPTSTHIVIDSGATFGVSPFEEVIIPGTVEEVNSSVKNLTGSSKIIKKGVGRWHIVDHLGKWQPLNHTSTFSLNLM